MNEVGYILEDPSYNYREEDQDEPRQNDIGSLIEQVEIAETPGVIPCNSGPEHEIMFEDNEYEESNPNMEVDTKVDINRSRVTRSGRAFGIQ